MQRGSWQAQAQWGTAPSWSGKFYELPGEDIGVMAVHISDTQTHRAPLGWQMIDLEAIGDSEVYTYRKVDV
jgi:hypothetical protein